MKHKKRLRWLAAALASLAGAGVVSAQENERSPMPAGITVQGKGEVQVKPDIVRLTLGVQTQDKDSAVAARENATRTSAVIAAVKGAGVADKDILTANYSIQPQYDYRPRPAGDDQPPRLIGYQVNNSVLVTVRRIGDAGKVIDAAIKAGSNVAGGIVFDREDPAPAQDAALQKAVADALRKARVVAGAANVSDLRLVSVVEGPVSFPRPYAEMAMMRGAAADAAQTPIQPGEQTVTAFVTARFAFAPGIPR